MAKQVAQKEAQPGEEKWKKFARLRVNKTDIKRRARKIESVTLKHAHRFLVARWTNVQSVSRRVAGWIVLIGLLLGLSLFQLFMHQRAYMTQAPASGGTYAEGFTGQIETLNPLFATTSAEVATTKLVFSGLLDYDDTNALRTNVAHSWKVSDDGKVYNVQLRKDVVWHDGEQLNADDVVFTVNLMKNERVKALQYASWVGVRVEKIDDYAVKFTLPTAYAPFAHSLTFGILPQHALANVSPVDIRENNFGRSPVGSGPFAFRRLQVIDQAKNRSVVHLEANKQYYKGAPLLDRFQVHTYETTEALARAYHTDEITAAVNLDAKHLGEALEKDPESHLSEGLINDGVFALFNADSSLFADESVRQALVRATNRQAIIDTIHGRGVALKSPFPTVMITNQSSRQTDYNVKRANEILDGAGWKIGKDNVREKSGAALALTIVASEEGDYMPVVTELARQWSEVGVRVKVELVKPKEIVTSYLQPRNYDVLVYEFVLGADKDIYAYWHSSQAQSRGLNFANYRSGVADDILSSARTQLSESMRDAKYRSFVEQWVKDAPAVALYQPKFSYISDAATVSFDEDQPLAETFMRYRNVERWAVRSRSVMSTPQ